MTNRTFDNILNANTVDPDDFRRRKLLNLILIGLTIVSLLTSFLGLVSPAASPQLPLLGLILVLANGVIYFINRFASGPIAAGIFLLMLILIISFGDEPQEVVEGRTLFFLAVPIVASSILLPSYTSFLVAAVAALLSIYLSLSSGIPVNSVGILGFLTVAFGTYMSARPLEAALREVRSLNRELDDRVEVRTRELATANERLTELDQLKTKFISDVSHELRTPVSNLNIYLDILESGERPEQRERFMDVLREETNRLIILVNDVLDLSHIDLGAYKNFSNHAVDLNEIVTTLVETQRLRANVLGLKLLVRLSERPARVNATTEQLTRITSNILGNSLKYTTEGQVTVNTHLTDDNVELSIKDTGIGIAENDLLHIFDRFYRGENVSKSTIPGSGLGLAIARELVVLLGGTIRIESAVGIGTTVTVSLPLAA